MEKRPTVESLSIDLVGTLKNIGIGIQVAMDLQETFKYYSIILLDWFAKSLKEHGTKNSDFLKRIHVLASANEREIMSPIELRKKLKNSKRTKSN